MEDVLSHYGQWVAVAVWVIVYGIFLAFIPFYRKSQRKPASVYLAFVIAFALEMFGVPMSVYMVTWALGRSLPEGVFWGHTLVQYIGYWGMYIGAVMMLIGAVFVILGWRIIHKRYWSQEVGHGQLVTEGIYRYIRHPQYTGFLLITLGMIAEWATIPLVLMWPVLLMLYTRLARREEQDIEREFGAAYVRYRQQTGMFFPRFRLVGTRVAHSSKSKP